MRTSIFRNGEVVSSLPLIFPAAAALPATVLILDGRASVVFGSFLELFGGLDFRPADIL